MTPEDDINNNFDWTLVKKDCNIVLHMRELYNTGFNCTSKGIDNMQYCRRKKNNN